jgi:excisionase family DNA binding protein
MSDRVFLTMTELAQVLRVTYNHIQKQVKAGEIPAVRIGKAVRIHRDTVRLLMTGSLPPAKPVVKRELSPETLALLRANAKKGSQKSAEVRRQRKLEREQAKLRGTTHVDQPTGEAPAP